VQANRDGDTLAFAKLEYAITIANDDPHTIIYACCVSGASIILPSSEWREQPKPKRRK